MQGPEAINSVLSLTPAKDPAMRRGRKEQKVDPACPRRAPSPVEWSGLPGVKFWCMSPVWGQRARRGWAGHGGLPEGGGLDDEAGLGEDGGWTRGWVLDVKALFCIYPGISDACQRTGIQQAAVHFKVSLSYFPYSCPVATKQRSSSALCLKIEGIPDP